MKEDIKINPNEKNRIYKIYNTKDIKKILRENNFPVSKNHLSNFNRASYSDNEKIANEFELNNQIFDTDNLLNNNKDEEEYYDEEKFFNELYMTKDNSKSITGPLS